MMGVRFDRKHGFYGRRRLEFDFAEFLDHTSFVLLAAIATAFVVYLIWLVRNQ